MDEVHSTDPHDGGAALDAWPRMIEMLERLASYSLASIFVELAVIWLLVFVVVRFVQDTRAAGALKGVLLLILVATLLVQIIGGREALPRLAYLYERALAVVAIGLVVIFQPELRRALVRLGETSLFRGGPAGVAAIVEPIVEACGYLSKARFGAIIVIERQVGLRGLVEGGTVLDADLNSRLLQTIFFPGTALHDLAVVIRGRVIHAAGVQLPLADPVDIPDRSLGSRHRAAVGVTKECDAIVVVVSEETGGIRVAERGRLSNPLSLDELRAELSRRLGETPPTMSEAKTAAEHQTAALSEGDGLKGN
ncbi:MAG TPA: diadenylate cyclase CdaA [Phycisphaerales bacterium]|nr:diadenylate cyclase CdaA [Phycisphaerales bacterium]